MCIFPLTGFSSFTAAKYGTRCPVHKYAMTPVPYSCAGHLISYVAAVKASSPIMHLPRRIGGGQSWGAQTPHSWLYIFGVRGGGGGGGGTHPFLTHLGVFYQNLIAGSLVYHQMSLYLASQPLAMIATPTGLSDSPSQEYE